MRNDLPKPTLRRLPIYFKLFNDALAEGKTHLSSHEIASDLGIDSTQVRKDIAMTGYVGKPKSGFEIEGFIKHLKVFLKLQRKKKTIVVGMGNLGVAISRYKGFDEYGLDIAGLFDSDLHKVGMKVRDCKISLVVEMPDFIRENTVEIAILTVPMDEAQAVTNLLVEAGIKGIWNFTPAQLKVPDNVIVWSQDLMAGFMTLLLLMQQKEEDIVVDGEDAKKHELRICMGSACHQLGAFDVLQAMKNFLKQYNVENRVHLKGAFCLGHCAEGIAVTLDDQLIKGVRIENVEEKFVNEILPVIR
ncbi:MAG: redox-sensing transcriptional repressor Rex [Candidatus Omnitrophica bacterium]|nr:redox-sensing transcriptional repressor Rex [Candidatus Omnitrophota bacterium]MDD5441358.1 redox-sensing transcriptional repressor Rex [Candidatus Omnitrophota bacterium]